jgi:hypothetical protein
MSDFLESSYLSAVMKPRFFQTTTSIAAMNATQAPQAVVEHYSGLYQTTAGAEASEAAY